MANYYEVLGVGRNATEKEIRQAYRKLARQYHPDVNKTDADAEGKFKEINEAYGVLSDEESRKKYDAYGDNWKHADQYEHSRGSTAGGTRWTFRDGGEVFSGFGGGSSIFEDLFSSGRASRGSATRRPRPTEQRVEITLEEAYHGTTRTVRTHDGRNLEVKIPAGVNDGSRVHVSPNGSQGNDFYLVVSVWDHPKFRREDSDLFTDIELPVDDAVLGTEVLAPTLTGRVSLTVPPNTPNERRFRLSGKGMPPLSGMGPAGDLYVTVKVRLPTDPTDGEIELFRELRELRMGRSAFDFTYDE